MRITIETGHVLGPRLRLAFEVDAPINSVRKFASIMMGLDHDHPLKWEDTYAKYKATPKPYKGFRPEIEYSCLSQDGKPPIVSERKKPIL